MTPREELYKLFKEYVNYDTRWTQDVIETRKRLTGKVVALFLKSLPREKEVSKPTNELMKQVFHRHRGINECLALVRKKWE